MRGIILSATLLCSTWLGTNARKSECRRECESVVQYLYDLSSDTTIEEVCNGPFKGLLANKCDTIMAHEKDLTSMMQKNTSPEEICGEINMCPTEQLVKTLTILDREEGGGSHRTA